MWNARTAEYEEFAALDIRVGTIVTAHVLEGAKKPAYVLQIDFGQEIGVKKSSAQITGCYNLGDLPGKQVIAIVNFPPKQIGKVMSECLVLGAVHSQGVSLLQPDRAVDNGLKIA